MILKLKHIQKPQPETPNSDFLNMESLPAAPRFGIFGGARR